MEILELSDRRQTLQRAAHAAVVGGRVLLFPTDTTYALGVPATDPDAVDRLNALKKRSHGKPVSIALPSVDMMEAVGNPGPVGRIMAEAFLPGAVTLIIRSGKRVARNVLGPGGSLGIRVPASEVARELLRASKVPLTATSANVAGGPPCYSVSQFVRQLRERGVKEDAFVGIDAGTLRVSPVSTVIDCSQRKPLVVREGSVPAHAVTAAWEAARRISSSKWEFAGPEEVQ